MRFVLGAANSVSATPRAERIARRAVSRLRTSRFTEWITNTAGTGPISTHASRGHGCNVFNCSRRLPVDAPANQIQSAVTTPSVTIETAIHDRRDGEWSTDVGVMRGASPGRH